MKSPPWNNDPGRVGRDEPRHRALSEVARPSGAGALWHPELPLPVARRPAHLLGLRDGDAHSRLVCADRDRIGAAADPGRIAQLHGDADSPDFRGDRRPHRSPRPAGDDAGHLCGARRHADDPGAERPSQVRSMSSSSWRSWVRSTVDPGVRGALVATIMPADRLVGAISLSRTTSDTARIAGALSGAGLLASLGIGPAYVAIFSLYISGHVADPVRRGPVGAGSGRCCRRRAAALADARAQGRRRPCLDHTTDARRGLDRIPRQSHRLSVLQRTAALYRAGLYRTNQAGLGYLSASFAVGSLAGSVALSLIGGLRVARLMIGATVTCGTAGVRAHPNRAGRDRLPDAGRVLAKPDHDQASRSF